MPHIVHTLQPVTQSELSLEGNGSSGAGDARRKNYWQIAAIVVFFVAAAAFISPRGNFPLNDDWMYSFAVQRFMETGKFEFVGPNCTSCLLHVVAGAALCKPFGFSHEVLRLFTLVLGCLNSIGVYLLIREFRVTRKLATLAALTYAGNPIFLNLVFSYMTDVASMTLATFSTLFTVRAIKQNSAIRLILPVCCSWPR